MPDTTEYEAQQIREANAAQRTPVVFIHGLWLLPSSWDRWRAVFEEAGYATLAPGWPDDPSTVKKKPALIGHSFGGLITQILAGRGLAAAAVAIDPAPFRGVLPLPVSALKSAAPVIGNPANRGRAVPLTYDQFRFAFANAVTEAEAHELHATFAVPGSGVTLFQAADANLNPWTEAKVDTKNPDRGPLLIIDGEMDHTVPWAVANAAYKRQKRNPGITEIVKIPGRGHSLTIDHGWREVAGLALTFVQKHAKP